MPEISICITCFNHARYIGQCIDSVLQQEGDFSLQILIGDDGSSDNTRDVICDYAQRYPDQVNAILQPVRLGASANLQSLIERATGDLIAHLDGDDFWLPGKLAAQLEALNQSPTAVAAYCNAQVINAEGDLVGFFNDHVPARFDLDYLTKCGNFLNTSSALYRNHARQAILAIDQDFIDYRTNIVLAAHGDFVFVSEPLVVYRWMVQNSLTSSSRDPIYKRYLDAIEDAARLGASTQAIDHCVRRYCRSLWYSALWPPQPGRLASSFGRLLEAPGLEQSRRKLLLWSLYALLELPQVAWRHVAGARSGRKIFFPTEHHRA